jgi:hypothetical protein
MKKTIVFYILIIFVCAMGLHAQTQPKTAVKKTPEKEFSVYICTNDGDIYYHKRGTCAGFRKCSETIKNIKSKAELKKFNKKKACQRCYGK